MRSASIGPSPRRGMRRRPRRRPVVGGPLVGRRDVGQLGQSSAAGRPARAAGGSRRHSGDRSPSRAITRSSKLPGSDARDSSRRAARTSSATSGTPRAPLLRRARAPSRSAARPRSPRSGPPARPGRAARAAAAAAGRRAVVIAAISSVSGWDRGHLVRLEARDEADAPRPLDAGEERREGARARVGVVEVLEDQDDRMALAEPDQDAEDALEEAGLAALGRRDGRMVEQRVRSGRAECGARARAGARPRCPGRAGRPAPSSDAASSVGRIARRIGAYGSSSPPGTARPAEDRERLGERGQPVGRLRRGSGSRRARPCPRPGPSSARRPLRPRGQGRTERTPTRAPRTSRS